jgi:hypothetical protein
MNIFKAFIAFFRRKTNGKDKVKKSAMLERDDVANLPVSRRENDAVNIYKNITQIDTIKGKDVISFKKISIDAIEKYRYQEITSDVIKGDLSSIVAGGAQIAAISALNPGGLFTATVSPQLLTTFANGTFSTMIHQGGSIAAHAGFQSISATVFAPIAIMQLLSMVTGQYYMNGITKQLKSIDRKINELIKFHHTEKIAKLENAQKLLKQLYDTQYPGIEHLTQVKAIEMEAGSIYSEYSKYLEDSQNAKLKINEDLELSSQKDFDKLFAVDDESGFSFNFYMVTTSDEILHLIPIIEFMLNVKMNSEQTDRTRQIEEIFNKISKYTEDDFFANSMGKIVLNNYYMPFIAKAKKIANATWFHKDECKARLKLLEQRMDGLKSNVLESSETLNIKTKLVEQMTSPIEILYSINEDGKNIVYIKQ